MEPASRKMYFREAGSIAQNASLRTDIYSVFDPVPIASVLFLSDQINTHHEL